MGHEFEEEKMNITRYQATWKNGIHLEKIFNSSTFKGFPVTPAVRTSFILEM